MNLRLISILLLSVWFSSHFETILVIKNKINIEQTDTDSETEDEVEKHYFIEKFYSCINPGLSFNINTVVSKFHISIYISDLITTLLDPPEKYQ